jgi:hypothetical protein
MPVGRSVGKRRTGAYTHENTLRRAVFELLSLLFLGMTLPRVTNVADKASRDAPRWSPNCPTDPQANGTPNDTDENET